MAGSAAKEQNRLDHNRLSKILILLKRVRFGSAGVQYWDVGVRVSYVGKIGC